MVSYGSHFSVLLLTSLSAVVVGFAPPSSVCAGVGYDAIDAMEPAASALPSLPVDATTLLISVAAEGSESAAVVRQGLINWGNPSEAFGGAILLVYIGFSVLAGIKYVVKDGWRPKF